MPIVFVYGSLMRGLGNHHLLERAAFVGHARTADALFTMRDMGAFPGVAEDGTSTVVGEVYYVTEEELAALDGLEGHPRFYCRRPVYVRMRPGGQPGELLAWTYIIPQKRVRMLPMVAHGDWRRHLEEREET